MAMQTDAEYLAREAATFRSDLVRVESAPLADRREARAAWGESLRTQSELIGERVAWLLDGLYGKGAYDAAREVAGNPRMNRVAWLGQTIAALEWQCASREARAEWKALPIGKRKTVDRAILKAIESRENR